MKRSKTVKQMNAVFQLYCGVNKLYINLRNLLGFSVRGVKSTRGIWAPPGFPEVNI
jgi:hypothetical protein